jgi:hypothetical protein
MNQNSQNKETIEDKIKVYFIKKANENMNNIVAKMKKSIKPQKKRYSN